MKLKKTKYYPVGIDRREIIDDPQRTGRDVALKYRGQNVTDLRGSHIMEHRNYDTYALVTPNNQVERQP